MFHLTIHNRLFRLSIGHDVAGAGGGGEMERWGIGATSRSWVHTGTRLLEAELQDLNEPLIYVSVFSSINWKNALTDHGKKLRKSY